MSQQHDAGTAADALEAVRQAHARIRETIEAKSSEIEACKQRITVLARSGTVPAEEALADVERDLDAYVARGRRKLDEWTAGRCRPSHSAEAVHLLPRSRPSVDSLLGVTELPNGHVRDPGEILAALLEDQIRAALKSRIEAACKEPTVPSHDERLAEIRKESERLEQLEREHDDLLDEQASLFGTAPSARTQRARRDQEQRERLEALNAPAQELSTDW